MLSLLRPSPCGLCYYSDFVNEEKNKNFQCLNNNSYSSLKYKWDSYIFPIMKNIEGWGGGWPKLKILSKCVQTLFSPENCKSR